MAECGLWKSAWRISSKYLLGFYKKDGFRLGFRLSVLNFMILEVLFCPGVGEAFASLSDRRLCHDVHIETMLKIYKGERE